MPVKIQDFEELSDSVSKNILFWKSLNVLFQIYPLKPFLLYIHLNLNWISK